MSEMKPYYETENSELFNCDFLDNELPDKCAQLIIADPPYYKVKGEFDFIWDSFDDYLKDVKLWGEECKRILADNGTLFWWGNSKKIAYSQIILDKSFRLINNIVWDKGSFMGLEKSEGLRSFAPCTERLLMYGSQAQDITGLQTIEKEYIAPKNPFAIAIRKARKEKGLSINEIAEYGHFYGNVNHGGSVTNWERGYNNPSKEQWNVLYEILPLRGMKYEELRQEYEELRQEYEELRQEYEELRRPFKNCFHFQEVIRLGNEQATTGSIYNHDTVKPEHLTRSLILTCSRKGDRIVVPFAGSGTECHMAIDEGRNFSAYELAEKHCKTTAKRIEKETRQLKLF